MTNHLQTYNTFFEWAGLPTLPVELSNLVKVEIFV